VAPWNVFWVKTAPVPIVVYTRNISLVQRTKHIPSTYLIVYSLLWGRAIRRFPRLSEADIFDGPEQFYIILSPTTISQPGLPRAGNCGTGNHPSQNALSAK